LKFYSVFVEETTFPIDTPYFSCLDTRKVTKESQEILNSPAAQTIGFQKINTGFFILMNLNML